MADNQNPSATSFATVCAVESILKSRLISLLINNHVVPDEIYEDNFTFSVMNCWMSDPQRTPEEIYELIGIYFPSIRVTFKEFIVKNNLTETFLATVVLNAFSVISEREQIVLTGQWAKLAKCVTKYYYKNKYVNAGESFFTNSTSRELAWILKACNTDICPDHALRLELFGLIWARNYLFELSFEELMEFFVKTISELDLDVIYNNHVHDLLFSPADLWLCFDKCRDILEMEQITDDVQARGLADIGQKITESLLNNKYSVEVKFLQNILKLTGILAQIARFRFQSKSRLLRVRLNYCMTIFMHKLMIFFKNGMESFAQICLHPFIYPYYKDLVDNITSGILDLSGKLNKWRKNKRITKFYQDKFRNLETRRNYIVYCMNSMSPPINLPPLLLKQELGMLKPTGNAKLQKIVFNQPNLPLSFNYSENRVDLKKYCDNRRQSDH